MNRLNAALAAVLLVLAALVGNLVGSVYAVSPSSTVSADAGAITAPNLAAVRDLASTGIAVRTGPGAWALRGITSANSAIGVSNPAGLLGNPTLTFDGAAATSLLTSATHTAAGVAKAHPFTIGPFFASSTTGVTITSMSANTVEILGGTTRRAWSDTTGATHVRLIWQTGAAGAAGSIGCVQCSADQSTWFFADGTPAGDCSDTAEGPQVPLDVANTLQTSGGWTQLGAACIGERYWRITTDQGNNSTSPVAITAYMLAEKRQ